MIVALVIALSVYGLLNYYVGRRGAQALAGYPGAKRLFLVLFIVSTSCFPIGRILMVLHKGTLAGPFVRVGAFHFAVMLYGFLSVVLIDLVRLVNAFVPFLPRALTARPGPTGLVLFLTVAAAIGLTMAAGAYNAVRPRIVDLDLTLPRKSGTADRLTAVVVSDIHLGTLIGRSRLEKIVDMINALSPDIVLLPGDIVDETVTAEDEREFGEVMRRMKPPLGVYAVPGNHEFYSGLERNLACLRACGIRVLVDEAVRVDDAFFLAGRRDPSSLAPGERRMAIPEILAGHGVDGSLPVILLDHQPLHLEEASLAGVDLQFSGHTHAGQLFPLDLVNTLFWELNWGYLRKGRTQFYVTSGVGTWGPPIRTGSRPEIVRVRLSFVPEGEGRGL